jgi:hypothetical protein
MIAFFSAASPAVAFSVLSADFPSVPFKDICMVRGVG